MSSYELLFFAAALAAIAGIAFAAARRDRRTCLSLRHEGIRTNKQIKQLLLDLQQHRGMTNAYLNGDAAFKPRVEKKQVEIGNDIGTLDASPGRALMTPQRWDNIKNNWHSLRGEALGLTQEESFRRNSVLIRDVLYLMGDVADRSQIVCSGSTNSALVHALWSDLPAVAEGLGQARGLGAGVAAKGHCTSIARIKLRFLEGRIGETMKRARAHLEEAGIARTLDASIARTWEETDRIVHEFLALLEEKLINAAKPAIDAEHYFGAATKALDIVFHVFDQASDALDDALTGARPKPA